MTGLALPRPSRKAMLTTLELLGLVLLFFLLHERLLDYFDSEGSFIITAGERLFKYGVLSTPEYQFFGDTAPSSPYYVAYFFAGLGVLLFGHTSLGAVAYSKFFTLLTVLVAYGTGRTMLRGRLWGWTAAGFVLLFPFARDFATTRPDWTCAFFGWAGLGLLAHALRLGREGFPASVRIPGREIDLLRLLPLAAGVSVALAFFSHPLGFQFYLGGGLVLLVGTWGPWRWVPRRETRWFLGGFAAMAAVFATLVINWDKYLYFANQFSSYTTQFLPLSEALSNLGANLDRVAGPFFFRYHGQPGLAEDGWGMTLLLAAIGALALFAWAAERKKGPAFRPARLLLLLLLQFLFLYVYGLPAYRQYIVHALPLLGLLLAAGLRGCVQAAASLENRLERPAKLALGGALALALAIPAAGALASGKTLFTAPKRYTLVQDAIRDFSSVIPKGSRVICSAGEIFLFPESQARSELVLLQFIQPPPEDMLLDEEAEDGIISNPAWYSARADQLRFVRNARSHFLRFLPDFITARDYAILNCATPAAEFHYSIRFAPPAKQDPQERKITVWKTNFNEFPFHQVPVGARLYPSFSDPVSAMRYREFLMAGTPRPVVKESPVLRADAGPDLEVPIPLDSETAEAVLDGSRSWSTDGGIISYEWEGPWKDEPTVYASKVLAEGVKVRRVFGLGEETLYLKVSDAKGRTSRDALKIRAFYDTSGLVNYAASESGGNATSRGVYSGLDPANAVDGRTGGTFAESWTSNPDPDSYLQIDLGAPRQVRAVLVHFRTDYKDASQTSGILLLASNDPEFATREQVGERPDDATYPRAGLWKALVSAPAPFRYIRLVKSTDSLTSLEEVEVYCLPAADTRKPDSAKGRMEGT
jgi:4-amino-4-deoxy-L-arabinose transferase-like glycosyltransferase